MLQSKIYKRAKPFTEGHCTPPVVTPLNSNMIERRDFHRSKEQTREHKYIGKSTYFKEFFPQDIEFAKSSFQEQDPTWETRISQ